MTKKVILQLKNVNKSFDGQKVINDLNLNINQGELFVLVGTSGSGKTTTLKMINQLITQDSGDIFLNQKNVKDYELRNLRLDIGYVLQQIALFPTMTVEQNIALIPEMKHIDKSKIKTKILELLKDVSLNPQKIMKRYPRELSGGEQQRVGILRALITNPPLILMDEPFSALDPLSRNKLQELLLNLHQKYHNTIVFVTHDITEALKMGDRIGVMNHGKLMQVGTKEEILKNPKNDFVKEFFNLQPTIKIRDIMIPASPDNNSNPKVEEDDNINSAFYQLIKYEWVNVVNEHNQVVGKLSRSDCFKYLSKQEEEK